MKTKTTTKKKKKPPLCTFCTGMQIEKGDQVVPAKSVVIDVEQLRRLLDSTDEAKRWEKSSIYKVPPSLVQRNEKVYRPKLVSVGPFHHGEAQLKAMEEHKHRALSQFLKRSKKTLSDLKETMTVIVAEAMDSYEELDEEWRDDEDKFCELMILDGCFVLEILRVFAGDEDVGYGAGDPVFGERGRCTVVHKLLEDVLLLENQVPFLVLDRLLAVENVIGDDPVTYMESFLMIFMGTYTKASREGYKPPHLLDLLRLRLVGTESGTVLRGRREYGIKSASTYKKAGIAYKESETNFLSDIKLENNVLHIPVLILLTVNETLWLNAWAFECLHTGLAGDISTFIRVMGGLLQSADDVRLLSSGWLFEVVRFVDEEKIIGLFKALNESIAILVDVDGRLLQVVARLNDCHRESTRKWRKRIREWSLNLKETYFKNPWTVLSLSAALLLIALTILQTVFTSLSFYSPRG